MNLRDFVDFLTDSRVRVQSDNVHNANVYLRAVFIARHVEGRGREVVSIRFLNILWREKRMKKMSLVPGAADGTRCAYGIFSWPLFFKLSLYTFIFYYHTIILPGYDHTYSII